MGEPASMTAHDPTLVESAEAELATFTPVQKLARLLFILEPEVAAQLLKKFDDHELDAVTQEMAKIQLVPREMQTAIMKEFATVAVRAGMSCRGGVQPTQALLSKAVGLFRASDVVNRVSPSRVPVPAMQEIMESEPRQVFNLLKHEQPQTIAFVLSHLPPEKASQALFLLRTDLREQVVERLATLSPTPIEVADKVVSILNARSRGRQPKALNSTGGVKSAAALLNALDKTLSKSIIAALQEKNPELAQLIQQKMFTFEDLTQIDPGGLQRVMREVDMQDLAMALKSASEKLKGLLLGSISKRAAETVNEEIAMMGAVRAKEIETAQLKIIEVVRRLEAEGELDLGNGAEAKNAGGG